MGTATPSIDLIPPRSVSYKRRIAIGIGIVLFGGALFIVFVFSLVTGVMRRSDPYQAALSRARINPAVVRVLGTPIKDGWFSQGNIEITATTGNADIAIPVSGPIGKGTLYVVAKKSAGEWQYTAMQFAAEGSTDRVNLLEEPVAPVDRELPPTAKR